MRKATQHSLVFVLMSALAVACDAPDSDWAGTVDTVQNRIVVSNPDVPRWTEAEVPVLQELYRVGSLDGPAATVFGQIRDIDLGADGSLYVLDGQAHEVRVFDASGEHVRTFGRKGQGPGELNGPAGMAFAPNGMLWVLNRGNARYSIYDPATGEVVRERPRATRYLVIPWPGRFDASGRLTDTGLSASGVPAAMVLDSAAVPADTILLPQLDARHRVNVLQEGTVIMTMTLPFSPQTIWTPHPSGGLVVGHGDVYKLYHVKAGSDTVMSIELQRPRAAVSSEEAEAALLSFRKGLESEPGSTFERAPTASSHKPPYIGVYVDATSRMWVRRGDGEKQVWDVFDASGKYLGAVTAPENMQGQILSISGDRLACILSLGGVETVAVFRISEKR